MVLTVTFTKSLYFSPVELVVVSDVLVVSDVVVGPMARMGSTVADGLGACITRSARGR